jgi:hypothetical protein
MGSRNIVRGLYFELLQSREKTYRMDKWNMAYDTKARNFGKGGLEEKIQFRGMRDRHEESDIQLAELCEAT